MADTDASYDRRFASLERLFGPGSQQSLRDAHFMVAGLGGVGTWCVEALARSGVGALTLIDMDHIAESNVNRQLHALSATLGQAKIEAMAQRVLGINPECQLSLVDDFVSPENVAQLFASGPTLVIDCTDQAQAKIAMILEARRRSVPLLVCGGAGGKTNPLALRAGDLSAATNDALLAKLRNTLRRLHAYPKASDTQGKQLKRLPKMNVRVLWFDQLAILPSQWGALRSDDVLGQAPQGLSCAGYGSVVTVTAAMGMAAANEALHYLLRARFGP